jgi:folate-binding protein YgfZ
MMNNDWRTFLDDAGAVFDDGIVHDFGNPKREQQASVSGTVMTDLSHLGVIRARGDDAATFLQGQLTNDINAVDDKHCQLSGYCNPQGRLLAIFQIFSHDGDYYLLLPASLIHETLERLRKFVLMARAELDDVSDDWVRIGVYGKQAGQRLQDLLDTALPDAQHNAGSSGKFKLLYLPGHSPRYMVFGPPQDMQGLWNSLDVHAAAVGAHNWGWQDIRAGLPVVYPETIGNFIPQMVNLDLLDAINFKKGCYTGQEIVARLHYRGKVKRRMYLAEIPRIDADTLPQPGDILYDDRHDEADKASGHIVRCQSSPSGGISLLAVITAETARSGLDGGHIHWRSATGPVLAPAPLPYSVPEAEA